MGSPDSHSCVGRIEVQFKVSGQQGSQKPRGIPESQGVAKALSVAEGGETGI